jgi:hypothetical protein
MAFCDIQKHTIDKEQESLYVKMLAPRETKIEEKLRKSFKFNSSFADFLLLFHFIVLGFFLEFLFIAAENIIREFLGAYVVQTFFINSLPGVFSLI